MFKIFAGLARTNLDQETEKKIFFLPSSEKLRTSIRGKILYTLVIGNDKLGTLPCLNCLNR